MSEQYISGPCSSGYHHECVSGPSVFNMKEKELCGCSCHEVDARMIERAKAAGLTQKELKNLWYRARGSKITF